MGILLHYSTLATMLWIGVTARNIYKQVTKKAPPCPRQPLLRYRAHAPGHLVYLPGGLGTPAHRETGSGDNPVCTGGQGRGGYWGQGGVPGRAVGVLG